ncbi:ATP-dependent transcriptional regulator, MalT-like, LuxR family [Paenibacillus algicola]|uniref:ATP-dependent transcriptional regulator, MalT-like, LuxR family n=1 Tax=Paenibacillus algicola TaxID=2565926 RepID=A0A4P8XNA7_9BACL|nr:ATP-dependent transcriptional regulator, MalT-like, LuxR family [Paenibacillus algicola]
MIQAKISPPVLKDNVIHRQQLIEQITLGSQGKVTSIIAPAGYGKSTLLAQWRTAAAHERKVHAWLTLDDRDNDPVRFWRYVVGSLYTSLPTDLKSRFLTLADMLPGASSGMFLDTLLYELSELPSESYIILDDLHVIDHPTIHDNLSYLIDYLPQHIHILLSSRTELPFSTIRWRVQKQAADISMDQLQFNEEETREYLHSLYGHSSMFITDQQIRDLTKQTEGWVTALQLASLSLQSSSPDELFMHVIGGDHRHLGEYLVSEVMSKLSKETQDFLLKTSVLSRLDTASCNAVTNLSNGQLMLNQLQKLNLFLVPLDEQDRWFRYHHLFAEFLQHRLLLEHPSVYRQLHVLAGQHFAENGWMDEALEHAIQAENYDLAELYLSSHLQHVLRRGELTTLRKWLYHISSHHTLSHELSLFHAFVLVLTGDMKQAEEILTKLEQICANMSSSERRNQLESSMLFVRSNLVFRNGDFGKWFVFSQGILDNIIPDNPIYLHFDYNLREPMVRRTSMGLNGVLSRDTEKIGLMFTDVLAAHGWKESLIHLYVKQSLCEGYYEWNRLEDSRRLAGEIAKSRSSVDTLGLLIPLRITEARLAAAEGQYTLAHYIIDETQQSVLSRNEHTWVLELRAFRARLLLQERNITQARKEVAALGIRPKDKPIYSREFQILTLVRLLGRQRKEPEGLRLLELLKLQAAREQQIASLVEISILQALLETQRGQVARGMTFLSEALTLGSQHGYIRSFLDEGPEMQHLLKQYAERSEVRHDAEAEGKLLDYVRMLGKQFPQPHEVELAAAAELTPSLPEALSRTELDLLNQIRQGASNKEIAANLSLSQGTIRVYLSRLYDKLEVSTRTQALVKAQALGIWDGDN